MIVPTGLGSRPWHASKSYEFLPDLLGRVGARRTNAWLCHGRDPYRALQMTSRTYRIHCTAIVLAAFASPAMAGAEPDWMKPLAPFFKDHCWRCHAGTDSRGGLDLQRLGTDLNDAEQFRRWVRVYDRIRDREMPPAGVTRPDATATRLILSRVGDVLLRADVGRRQSVLRRLNRVEYENTVRDLFGIRIELKDMLPKDPSAHGFDTVGEVLALSPEQMEVYLRAADRALDQVFGPAKAPKRVSERMPLGRDRFASRSVGQLFVKTDDDSLITFQGYWCPSVFLSGQATADGTYRVRIKAKAYQTDKPVVMAVYGGDVIVGRAPSHLVGYFDVAPGDQWTVVTFEDFLETHGCYQMKPYDLRAPTQGPERFKGPGLMIGEVDVQGPLEAWPPPSRVKLLGDVDPKSATAEDARRILTRLLPRAFRRPVFASDVEPYVALAKSALDRGRPFPDALRVALQGVLCAPEFLLREEPGAATRPGGPEVVSAHALASRLSYFLWGSLPDDDLLAAADSGQLRQPEVLRAHTERLLRDPKSERFVKDFTGQWLGLRDIDFTEPDMRQYPEYDEMLRHAMVEETYRFFRTVLDGDRPLLEFVDSDWTVLNERLARHYCIGGVTGQTFRRVALAPGSIRGGVMTQASVLKVTANGTNTSPVVRGVWVLDRIVGRPVPPPPAGVPAIEPDIRGATTVREQLNRHRNVASCAACHRHIDPPGFALESFDPIGGWREWYRSLGKGEPVNLQIHNRRVQYRRGPSVDASGRMPDGRTFADVREFKRLLLEDKDQLARALAEKLLTYALGRGLGFSDRPGVNDIVAKVKGKKYGFRSLIHEVVQCEMFRQK